MIDYLYFIVYISLRLGVIYVAIFTCCIFLLMYDHLRFIMYIRLRSCVIYFIFLNYYQNNFYACASASVRWGVLRKYLDLADNLGL